MCDAAGNSSSSTPTPRRLPMPTTRLHGLYTTSVLGVLGVLRIERGNPVAHIHPVCNEQDIGELRQFVRRIAHRQVRRQRLARVPPVAFSGILIYAHRFAVHHRRARPRYHGRIRLDPPAELAAQQVNGKRPKHGPCDADVITAVAPMAFATRSARASAPPTCPDSTLTANRPAVIQRTLPPHRYAYPRCAPPAA